MEILEDILLVNKSTIKKAFKLFVNNWIIIFTGLAYTTINIIVFNIVRFLFTGILSIIGGILIALGTAALISNYLYILHNVVKCGKFTFDDFKNGFKAYLWKVYGVLFIGWVASLFLNMFLIRILTVFISPAIIMAIVTIVVAVLFNAIPESIYMKYYSPWETITYELNFIKENLIEWFVPNIILFLILYFTTGKILNNVFMLNFLFVRNISLSGIIIYIVGQVIFSFIMIYRGVLFEKLSTSTRRKRMFMRDMYR